MTENKWIKDEYVCDLNRYNNQWMVVDYKKFKPGGPLPKSGLLAVLEQIPWVYIT